MCRGISACFQSVTTACSQVAHGIGDGIKSSSDKTSKFIKNNWKSIIAYILAWNIVIVCSGLLYSFQAVAIPLSIGFGGGALLGGISGLLTTHVFDANGNWTGKNTAWDVINIAINHLDPNGTRPIVTSISVTVLLAAAVIYPYVIGALLGALVANQVITKIGFGRNLGPDPLDHRNKVATIQEQLAELQTRLMELEQQSVQLKESKHASSS